MTENRKNYFFWNQCCFETAIKKAVCAKCKYFDAKGVCHTPDPRGCALFRYLPQLVMIAQHLKEPVAGEYVKQVACGIKMECAEPDGACKLYDTLGCGLKERLPLVLNSILETDKALEARKGFGDCECDNAVIYSHASYIPSD